jgi:hypothetical protein
MGEGMKRSLPVAALLFAVIIGTGILWYQAGLRIGLRQAESRVTVMSLHIPKNKPYKNFPVWFFAAGSLEQQIGLSGLTWKQIACRISKDGDAAWLHPELEPEDDWHEREVQNLPGRYSIDLRAFETNAEILDVECIAPGAIPFRATVTTYEETQ